MTAPRKPTSLCTYPFTLNLTSAALLALLAPSVMAGSNSPQPGDPLPKLNPEQLKLFNDGEDYFVRELSVAEGLGPVFIEKSCLSCHALGGIGGGDSLTNTNHFVERFGQLDFQLDGTYKYNNLAALGGDVLQTHSINELLPNSICPESEIIPWPALIVTPEKPVNALRNPLPMFGIGLIAAIPDATIWNGIPRTADADGVIGRPNFIGGSIGRFGWKAQTVSLPVFNANAANGTMGLTTSFFPAEQKPQGLTISQTVDNPCSNLALGATSPNDLSGDFIREVTAWAAMLAPVTPKKIDGEALRGQKLFTSTGCAKCHTPAMQTDTTAKTFVLADGLTPDTQLNLAFEAVKSKPVKLYSDLLLHDLGKDEGVTMATAKGSEFRTAPLWGIRLRERFMHDGSARSIHEAILTHGGEAEIIRGKYAKLRNRDQEAIREFLNKI